MATHNATTPSSLPPEASCAESAFVSRARQDGYLDADGYFVGPPDDFEFDAIVNEPPTADEAFPSRAECAGSVDAALLTKQ